MQPRSIYFDPLHLYFVYFDLSFIYNPTNKKLYLHGSTSILDNSYSLNQKFV